VNKRNSMASGQVEPFSIFTTPQKRWISYVAAFGAMFSTLNSYIYFPALVPMATDLRVSVTMINLTVTCYLVIAGLAPAFMGDFADREGRRPAYLVMVVLSIGSNVGLALQTSYPALFALRMIQAAGTSGAFSAASGVVSDIAPPHERGTYSGTIILLFVSSPNSATTSTNTAPSFGPVIGGVLAYKIGWNWIFWFLTILTCAHGIILILFFPETQRKLVGNGSKPVKGILYWNIFSWIFRHEPMERLNTQPQPRKHRIPNPLASLPVLLNKGNFCVILFASISYAIRMVLQASLGAQCITLYSLNYLQGGLIYLPAGISGAIGAKLGGIYVDRQYVRTYKKLNCTFGDGERDIDFPIEKSRLRGAHVITIITALGTIGYGLALHFHSHISIMLVIQFITSFTSSIIFAMTGTLLTDLNPDKAATASAASNFIRCLLAGGCIAALEPLTNQVGLGWCFGIFGLLQVLAIPFIALLELKAVTWRKE
ncbi:unnamed protein product, partial [Clonostachys rhizophaga]